MKRTNGFIKRCLAMFLSIAMCVTGMNFVVAPAFAAESGQTITVGDLMAIAYADKLSSTEEKVLKSDMLYGSDTVITYDRITDSDGLVSVDAETKTITAQYYTKDGAGEKYSWKPVSFDLVAGGSIVESGTVSTQRSTVFLRQVKNFWY